MHCLIEYRYTLLHLSRHISVFKVIIKIKAAVPFIVTIAIITFKYITRCYDERACDAINHLTTDSTSLKPH